MKSGVLTTLQELQAGEISIEEATVKIADLVTETVSEAVSSIEVVDAYAMSAISALGGSGDPDDIAERAFSIATACLRERVRCILDLLPDDDPDDDDDEGGGDAG